MPQAISKTPSLLPSKSMSASANGHHLPPLGSPGSCRHLPCTAFLKHPHPFLSLHPTFCSQQKPEWSSQHICAITSPLRSPSGLPISLRVKSKVLDKAGDSRRSHRLSDVLAVPPALLPLSSRHTLSWCPVALPLYELDATLQQPVCGSSAWSIPPPLTPAPLPFLL